MTIVREDRQGGDEDGTRQEDAVQVHLRQRLELIFNRPMGSPESARRGGGETSRASYLARQSVATSHAVQDFTQNREISHQYEAGIGPTFNLHLDSHPPARPKKPPPGMGAIPSKPTESTSNKIRRVMDAAAVDFLLARAALHWSLGDELEAVANLNKDVSTIMQDNKVGRAKAVDALSNALTAQIAAVMSACGAPYSLASASLNWSMGDQDEAITNLRKDIDDLMQRNRVTQQEAVRALSEALLDPSLAWELENEPLHPEASHPRAPESSVYVPFNPASGMPRVIVEGIDLGLQDDAARESLSVTDTAGGVSPPRAPRSQRLLVAERSFGVVTGDGRKSEASQGGLNAAGLKSWTVEQVGAFFRQLGFSSAAVIGVCVCVCVCVCVLQFCVFVCDFVR